MPSLAPDEARVGVFEVTREIQEIGARPGDRIVVGRGENWPVALARTLSLTDARWALQSEHAKLEFTLPYDTPVQDAVRELRASFPHLTILH